MNKKDKKEKLSKSVAFERNALLLFLVEYHEICSCSGKDLKLCRKKLIQQIAKGEHIYGPTNVTKDWTEKYSAKLKKILKKDKK